jgi:hypothetical protein
MPNHIPEDLNLQQHCCTNLKITPKLLIVIAYRMIRYQLKGQVASKQMK